jgi:hypothetical protein
MKQLHEILTPKEETNCRIFVNRDVNAYKNILLLRKCYLMNQTRPEEFKRQVVKKEVIKKPRKKTTNRCSVWVVRRNNILVGTCISNPILCTSKKPTILNLARMRVYFLPS